MGFGHARGNIGTDDGHRPPAVEVHILLLNPETVAGSGVIS